MSRISTIPDLPPRLSEIIGSTGPFWKNSKLSIQRWICFTKNYFQFKISHSQYQKCRYFLSRSNQPATADRLNSQKGFATALLLVALPALLAGLMFFVFSGFLVKNWMQSLHTCRSELMRTQELASQDLNALMKLNPLAKTLRLRLKLAYIKLAAAIAHYNWGMAAQARLEIAQIQAQQRQLDLTQKALIQMANVKMAMGLYKAYQSLRMQNQINQTRIPWFFSFRIDPRPPSPVLLAVKPDIPEVAPVYELKNPFSRSQALSLSWISSFASGKGDKMLWIQNRHSKKDYCSVSLEEKGSSFAVKMIADR